MCNGCSNIAWTQLNALYLSYFISSCQILKCGLSLIFNASTVFVGWITNVRLVMNTRCLP